MQNYRGVGTKVSPSLLFLSGVGTQLVPLFFGIFFYYCGVGTKWSFFIHVVCVLNVIDKTVSFSTFSDTLDSGFWGTRRQGYGKKMLVDRSVIDEQDTNIKDKREHILCRLLPQKKKEGPKKKGRGPFWADSIEDKYMLETT